ncbi:hypothetical protein NPX13_g11021 [Xylaria arbuscula]|uniref:Uncharacterized protein n=1 Tax=Xylaria arbuscula TaxID=114810 RepID=A0A9W8N3G1_9PEZI|nr:hypothetical protein NPX13_g11021 [Xylaria arbuscula]
MDSSSATPDLISGYKSSSRSTSPPPRYAHPTASSIAHSVSALPNPHPIATDSRHVTQLWREVMSYAKATASSKNKYPKNGASNVTSSQATSTRVPKVGDANFQEHVLGGLYGVYIKRHNDEPPTTVNSFYAHLNLSQLGLPDSREKRIAHYIGSSDQEASTTQDASPSQEPPAIPVHGKLTMWRDPTNELLTDLQRAYQYMQESKLYEAEYQLCSVNHVFLDAEHRRWPNSFRFSNQCLLPVRALQLPQKPKKGDSTWKAPPCLSRSILPLALYEWDIKPDCQYYISLRAFPKRSRMRLSTYIYVIHENRGCSAYLSIEFKKDNEPDEKARSQVAVASALALYNRWVLKDKAIKYDGRRWDENDKSQMRHFSITALGNHWEIRETTPTSFDKWTGCTMRSLQRGQVNIEDHAYEILSALNDIHAWGLMVHGRSVVADFERVDTAKGVKTLKLFIELRSSLKRCVPALVMISMDEDHPGSLVDALTDALIGAANNLHFSKGSDVIVLFRHSAIDNYQLFTPSPSREAYNLVFTQLLHHQQYRQQYYQKELAFKQTKKALPRHKLPGFQDHQQLSQVPNTAWHNAPSPTSHPADLSTRPSIHAQDDQSTSASTATLTGLTASPGTANATRHAFSPSPSSLPALRLLPAVLLLCRERE